MLSLSTGPAPEGESPSTSGLPLCSCASLLQVQEVGWHDVAGWLGRGGSMLGTKR